MPTSDREYLAQTAALLAARAVSLSLSQGSHVAVRDATDLHKLATRQHRISERQCNEDLSCKYCDGNGTMLGPDEGMICRHCAGRGSSTGLLELRIEQRATAIAERYQLRVYIQGDPRGCPLYLVPNENGLQSEDCFNYNSRGHAVCHMGR